jgi:hypothetical protein
LFLQQPAAALLWPAAIFSDHLIQDAVSRLFVLCVCSLPVEECIQFAHSRCAVRPAPSFPGRPRAQDPSAEEMISVPPLLPVSFHRCCIAGMSNKFCSVSIRGEHCLPWIFCCSTALSRTGWSRHLCLRPGCSFLAALAAAAKLMCTACRCSPPDALLIRRTALPSDCLPWRHGAHRPV